MALYPLPPSSNESVIDNGRNVWQMAMHIILVLPNNLLKQCRLSLTLTLPWRFSVHCEMNNLEQSKKIRFLPFFLFLHAQKWVASVDECRTEANACHALPIWRLQSGLQKPIDDISDGPAPPAFFFAWTCSRSRNDLQHFIGDLLLSASAAVRLVDGRAFLLLFFFFFFFFLLSIAQRIRSKPPPSHMKVLSFVRDVQTFEMTPKINLGVHRYSRWLYTQQQSFQQSFY